MAHIVGNVIEKAINSRNPYLISFGEEGLTRDDSQLFVANNSVYSRYDKMILIRSAAQQPAVVVNNLIGGATIPIGGGIC